MGKWRQATDCGRPGLPCGGRKRKLKCIEIGIHHLEVQSHRLGDVAGEGLLPVPAHDPGDAVADQDIAIGERVPGQRLARLVLQFDPNLPGPAGRIIEFEVIARVRERHGDHGAARIGRVTRDKTVGPQRNALDVVVFLEVVAGHEERDLGGPGGDDAAAQAWVIVARAPVAEFRPRAHERLHERPLKDRAAGLGQAEHQVVRIAGKGIRRRRLVPGEPRDFHGALLVQRQRPPTGIEAVRQHDIEPGRSEIRHGAGFVEVFPRGVAVGHGLWLRPSHEIAGNRAKRRAHARPNDHPVRQGARVRRRHGVPPAEIADECLLGLRPADAATIEGVSPFTFQIRLDRQLMPHPTIGRTQQLRLQALAACPARRSPSRISIALTRSLAGVPGRGS